MLTYWRVIVLDPGVISVHHKSEKMENAAREHYSLFGNIPALSLWSSHPFSSYTVDQDVFIVFCVIHCYSIPTPCTTPRHTLWFSLHIGLCRSCPLLLPQRRGRCPPPPYSHVNTVCINTQTSRFSCTDSPQSRGTPLTSTLSDEKVGGDTFVNHLHWSDRLFLHLWTSLRRIFPCALPAGWEGRKELAFLAER